MGAEILAAVALGATAAGGLSALNRPKSPPIPKAPDPLQVQKEPDSNLATALRKRTRSSGKGKQPGLTLFSGGNLNDSIFNLGSKSTLGG